MTQVEKKNQILTEHSFFLLLFLFSLATTDKIFSIEGNGLKFDTVESIEPYLKQLNEVEDLEEIRLGGNTLGIQACAAVGSELVTKPNLKVSAHTDLHQEFLTNLVENFIDSRFLRHFYRKINFWNSFSFKIFMYFITLFITFNFIRF